MKCIHKLDILGVASGIIPFSIHVTSFEALPGPNSLAPPGEDQTSPEIKFLNEISNSELKSALKNPSDFDELYMVYRASPPPITLLTNL